MSLHDLFLLSPEVALALLALGVVGLDLVVERKGAVVAVAAGGLVIPLAFTLLLWGEVSGWWDLLPPQAGEVPGVAIPGVFNTLVVDRFALFFKGLFLASVALVLMASVEWAPRLGRWLGEYCALLLVSAGGMMLLAAATELITLYISLELTALPLAALAAFQRDTRSSEAGLKFLLLSGVASAVLLYGLVLTYGFAGSTWLQDIRGALVAVGQGGVPFGGYALLAGVVLLTAGFGFKVAAVPFQMWVPDVYEGAPTPITAYLSVASKTAGFAALLRVFYTAFGPAREEWALLFAVLSALSMTLGNLVAVAQSNIKRMLAYSTVAHAGYLLVGVAAVTGGPQGASLGPGTLLFYLAAYTFTNLATFFAVIAITRRLGSEVIDGFAGMGRRSPLLALALALGLVSLTGIPPTAGFMAKLFIFSAAVQSGLAWLAVVGVLNSVLSAYYYIRVIRVMFLLPPPSPEPVSATPPLNTALAVTALGVVVFGVLPFPLLRLAEVAARALASP